MRGFLPVAALALAACTDHTHITVTQIEIADASDSFGTPEIEVYMFDDDDALVACAGSKQGLLDVDVANTLYTLNVPMIDKDGETDLSIGSGHFRFEVWEDDDDPVCPVYPDRTMNDVLGVGPSMSLAQWERFDGTLQFDAVNALTIRFH